MTFQDGRRGSRTPKAVEAHPFSRRDTAPVAVLPRVAPAGVEPAPRRLRVGSSAALSYGAGDDVAGRSRTCGAPRFRRPLYRTELRPRMSCGMGEAGLEPADILFVETSALGRLSYSPADAREDPGQGLEPRSPRSERGVLPARRSRIDDRCRCVHGTFGQAERCCSCHSPTLRPWIARSFKSSGVLRGGDLEPGALAVSGNLQAKAAAYSAANSACAKRRGAFLSQAGPRVGMWFLKLSITPWLSLGSGLKTTKATRWVAFAQSWMRLVC